MLNGMNVTRRIVLAVVGVALVLSLGGCSATSAPRVLTPQGVLPAVTWTEQELQREVVSRPLRRMEHGSLGIVRVRTAEKPHVHDHTDLVVTVLRGRVRMHLGEQVVDLKPGDAVDIPRGVPHWAQNLGPGASEALVVATPAYDGSDMRPLPGKP